MSAIPGALDVYVVEVERLRRAIMARSMQMHPWYGVCDEMGPGGGCAECQKILTKLERVRDAMEETP